MHSHKNRLGRAIWLLAILLVIGVATPIIIHLRARAIASRGVLKPIKEFTGLLWLDFSPDGKALYLVKNADATGAFPYQIQAITRYDLTTNRKMRYPVQSITLQYVFSPDSKNIAWIEGVGTGGQPGTLFTQSLSVDPAASRTKSFPLPIKEVGRFEWVTGDRFLIIGEKAGLWNPSQRKFTELSCSEGIYSADKRLLLYQDDRYDIHLLDLVTLNDRILMNMQPLSADAQPGVDVRRDVIRVSKDSILYGTVIGYPGDGIQSRYYRYNPRTGKTSVWRDLITSTIGTRYFSSDLRYCYDYQLSEGSLEDDRYLLYRLPE